MGHYVNIYPRDHGGGWECCPQSFIKTGFSFQSTRVSEFEGFIMCFAICTSIAPCFFLLHKHVHATYIAELKS